MIHPINLPEELLALNPTRPSLIELRRKPKITYTPDGRKMRDGVPTTPKSPNGLWESVFVRSFIHRMAHDAKIEAEETSSIESLIDIVDLHPSSEVRSSTSDLALATDRPEISSDDQIEPRFAFTKRSVEELYDGEETGIFRRSSRQFSKSSPSAIIEPELIDPIMKPCCSSSEIRCKYKCSHSRELSILKEFLRFDFSQSEKLFESQNESREESESKEESKNTFRKEFESVSNSDSEDPATRKSSVTLIPDTLGSRIWINKPLIKSPTHIQSPSDRKTELLFNVKNVRVTRDNILKIEIEAHNRSFKKIKLETNVHLHLAKGQDIKDRLFSHEEVFELNPQVNSLGLTVDLNSVDLSEVFQEHDQYAVVTVLGHITCC